MSRPVKARNQTFVLNNPYDQGRWESAQQLIEEFPKAYPSLLFACWCLEEGENKTPHWQGVACFPNPVCGKKLGRFLKGAHVEGMKGTIKQAADYCRREGKYEDKPGRLDGPWFIGNEPEQEGQGKRTDLDAAAELHYEMGGGPEADLQVACTYCGTWIRYGEAIKKRSQLITALRGQAKMPEPIEVIWHFGPTGTGKTRKVYEIEGTAVDTVTLSGQRECPFFNGLNGLPSMLLDDLRPENATFSFFLRLLDRYPIWLNVKGATTPRVAKRIYITSHLSPVDFANASGGVAEDPRQLTRRITKVVDFSRIHEDKSEPEFEVLEEEVPPTRPGTPEPGQKRGKDELSDDEEEEELQASPLKRQRAGFFAPVPETPEHD